ncbi:MAG: ATP-binding cassette domain-containing protein [Methanomassiliicoccales archaeon]|nr:ATP-binding cassette domain-containing protein [Methanomassiliicoccales archaeon]
MSDFIVQSIGLSRHFGNVIAVDSLDLAVEEGRIFGLLGPNGAGKTTTIKILTTLLAPTSGRGVIAGFDVVKEPRKVRKVIGYVPQMLSADANLTGYENLLIFAKIYEVPRKELKERIEQAIASMGLSDFAHKLVRTYSGGMIRRLEIAQSAIHHPRVLFLDEPTVGLDPLARRTVWEMIRRLRDEYNTTIFLTTHMMDEADALCDEIGIMHKGKLVAVGSPSELKRITSAETLDEVFIHYTGSSIESGGSFLEVQRKRQTARRLG